MRDLLGTPLIQGDVFRPTKNRDRTSFWTAWFLALVVLTPCGVAYGKLAAARKIAQMKECVSQVGDVDECRKINSWPFKSFYSEKTSKNT